MFHVKPSHGNASLALTAQMTAMTVYEQIPVRLNDSITQLAVTHQVRLCPSRDGWLAHCDASYGCPLTTYYRPGRRLLPLSMFSLRT